jgi:corrinoid protein of di/trimethylamine methyltransferase
MSAILKDIEKAIINLDEKTPELVRKALAQGVPGIDIINKGLTKGVKKIGEMFEKGDIFLPELMISGEIMNDCIGIIRPTLPKSEIEKRKKVVIGTVQGDLHTIGKDLVAAFLNASGFEVYDLGCDVNRFTFLDKVKETDADILAMSALMTSSMNYFAQVIRDLEDSGLRERTRVMVGGTMVSAEMAEQWGSDGTAVDAKEAAELAIRLTKEG